MPAQCGSRVDTQLRRDGEKAKVIILERERERENSCLDALICTVTIVAFYAMFGVTR